MNLVKQSVPVKYFVFFIVGILILNYFVSVYFPVSEFASKDNVSQYVEEVYRTELAWFVTSWFLAAPTGLVLIPGFLAYMSPFNYSAILRIIVWASAIISIPLTIKLTNKIPKVARIFLAYFVSINIAAIGFIEFYPDFGR